MKNLKKIIPGILFALFAVFLFKSYLLHFASFGCFDECFNYLGGYFILEGRTLYSEIFFNHQMLMAYLSALIQKTLTPESIYYLVLQHRMFVFFFGIAANVLIMWRFGLPGILFAFLFEATKFYLMGSLFLAESLLVYPLVYLLGLAWQKLNGGKLSTFDYVISACMAWFVVFIREPMVLVALFLFLLINAGKRLQRPNFLSIGLFFALSLITLLFTSLPDYISQVVILNSKTIFLSEVSSYGNGFLAIAKIFFYPIVILFDGQWTFFREILIGIDVIFLISLFVFLIKSKKKWPAILLLIVLGLANLRVVPPGMMFYGAFHMLPWYGLFIMSSFLLAQKVYVNKHTKKLGFGLFLFIIAIFIYTVLPSKSIHYEFLERNESFELSFDRYYIYGQAISYLAAPGDRLYLESWDELIYWQAKLPPAYKYALYRNVDRVLPAFSQERANMFANSPPEFYYSFHENGLHPLGFLPDFLVGDYVELLHADGPSGLYIKKTKLAAITKEQWEKAHVLKFSL